MWGDKGESGLALKVWGDLGVFCFRDRLTDGYLSAKDAAAIEAKKGIEEEKSFFFWFFFLKKNKV